MKTMLLLFAIFSISGCMAAIPAAVIGTGVAVESMSRPTAILNKYSDDQIERCERSLTRAERQEIKQAVVRTAFIPFVGAFMSDQAMYAEAERICIEKGVL